MASRRDPEELVSGLMVKVSFIEEGDPVKVHFRSFVYPISPDFCAMLDNNNRLLCKNGVGGGGVGLQ